MDEVIYYIIIFQANNGDETTLYDIDIFRSEILVKMVDGVLMGKKH